MMPWIKIANQIVISWIFSRLSNGNDFKYKKKTDRPETKQNATISSNVGPFFNRPPHTFDHPPRRSGEAVRLVVRPPFGRHS